MTTMSDFSGFRVDVHTDDGVLDCHVFQPSGVGPWRAVIVYMDAFGIRPNLASMARRLADHGYAVILPNLYYRTGAFPPFDPVQVAAGGAERERFSAMIRSIDAPMVMRDTAAVLAQVDRMPGVRPGTVGAVGYCMGGGYALSAAGTFPDRVAAAASFHGGSLATDKPHSPHLLAPRMRAEVYVGVAEFDQSFGADQLRRLDAALTEAGVRHTIEVYAGAKHGFAVTGHLVYDRDASERHWLRLVDLLRRTL
jgi:carboxymethylenebutenolidase